ncbi:unnamed protein product [Parascedosporium putredinis]|uniref:Carboxylic ester hydrolase n=1 Tax=Parascedosporium putredinis TaxID=1442378 RepID=A0A9P1GYI9_9PEZI|nr:unnamed protein product [Parascedosporium putredinis]CAI7991801.1 unnamed protein product [Parascedosporium putredinis]
MKVSLALLGLTALARAQFGGGGGGLQQVSNFGDNPSNAKMFVYVPTTLAEKPPSSGTCWDVSSQATLTRDGGANSNSIANMVKHVISEYDADAEKVFVTGTSSGAMMTNVLASTYPDMFQAAIHLRQRPGLRHPERWAQWVFEAYPDYNGTRPRMQIYHGSADTTLGSANYAEQIKQWCGVFGCDPDAPDNKESNAPSRATPAPPTSMASSRASGPRASATTSPSGRRRYEVVRLVSGASNRTAE